MTDIKPQREFCNEKLMFAHFFLKDGWYIISEREIEEGEKKEEKR